MRVRAGVLVCALVAVGCSSADVSVSSPSEFVTAERVTSTPTPGPTGTSTATAGPSQTTPPPTTLPSPMPSVAPGPPASPTPNPTSDPGERPDLLTADDSGGTFMLGLGDTLIVRLGEEGLHWSMLTEKGGSVTVHERLFLVDPGYREWEVRGLRPGSSTIRATGDPPCRSEHPPCAAPSRLFDATIVVA